MPTVVSVSRPPPTDRGTRDVKGLREPVTEWMRQPVIAREDMTGASREGLRQGRTAGR